MTADPAASSTGPRVPSILGLPSRRPRLTLLITTILCIAAAWSVSRIRPTASLEAMVGGSSPSAAAFERIIASFRGIDDLFLLATDDATPDAAHAAARLHAFADAFETAVRADPQTAALCARIAVGPAPDATEFLRNVAIPAGLWYLDDESLAQLRERLTLTAMREQFRRNEAIIAAPGSAGKALLRDALHLHEFVSSRMRAMGAGEDGGGGSEGSAGLSPDGRALLIRITGARPASDLDFCQRLTDHIDSAARRAGAAEESRGTVRVQFAGAYAIAAAASSSIRRDMIANTFWGVVCTYLMFLLAYRRPAAFLLAFVPVALAVLLAFGTHATYRTTLTPLTAVTGAALAGMGIDYCIHYLSHYHAREHASAPEAADRTLRAIGIPLLAAGLTSAHGFIAIAFAGVAALRDFALLGALGLLWSMIAAATVLPAMLALRPRPVRPRFGVERFIRAVCARPRPWAIAAGPILAAAIGVTLLLAGHPIRMETDLTTMHPRPSPPLDAQREISRRFGGLGDSLLVLIEAGSAEQLASRSHQVDRALTSTAARDLGLTRTLGLASLIPDPTLRESRRAALAAFDSESILRDFSAALDASPFNPAAFADYADFLRTFTSTREPPGPEALAPYPSLADSVVAAPAPSAPGPWLGLSAIFFDRNLDDRDHRAAAVEGTRHLLSTAGPGITLTGVNVVALDLESLVRRALPRVLLISAAAVALTVAVAFRRPGQILLVFLPGVYGLAAVLVWMSLRAERLNMASMLAFPLLMGICIDYGIFMVGEARASRREHEPAEGLIRRFSSNAHAILITSGTTIIGFGTLISSSTPAIQSLGRLVTVGLAGSVIGTLLVLVPILHARHRDH